MFRAFHDQLAKANRPTLNVLELGSGPGFLASYLLKEMPGVSMTLLDFSSAMHDLASARLGAAAKRVTFVLRDFKSPAWAAGLGGYDAVLTNQAVHELRHKRYAITLHSQVAPLVARGGFYLVADHYCGEGGMANDQLFMSIEEQASALRNAGYRNVELVSKAGSLVMHCAA
jgi:cyclopropane fatty-acyl-phospholipid synthase-like methyltransferase